MNTSMFKGSGVAIVTPFHSDGSINFEELGRLIDFQIENDTDAIIICGTTGEASTLTDEEQWEAVAFTVRHVNKRVPVIAGAGSNHTDHGVELCKGCQKAGADGLLIATPYYNKTTQKGLVAHFGKLAAAVDLPIMLYNIPGRTGIAINPKTFCQLSKIDNIVAVKEASGNFAAIAETAYLCEGKLDLYSGDDNCVLPILSLGGIGVVSVLANVAPRNTHLMVDQYLKGDRDGATKLQLDAIPLINALFCQVNPIPVKAALNMMGFQVGGYRAPLCELEQEDYEHVKKAMKDYGLI